MKTTAADVKATFDGLVEKLNLKESHSGWFNGLCPAHEDTKNSFGMIIEDDGSVRFNCFAGCKRKGILQSLNFSESRPR